MEVGKDGWVEKAKEHIKKFIHRGGNGRGDEDQTLYGVNLQNTVGYALNLSMKDPNLWTEEETKKEAIEEFCYYVGEPRTSIDKIIDKLYAGVDRDVPCSMTILPIELYCDGKLYELPLFRFKFRQMEVTIDCKFIDSIGRVYLSFDDFLKNNKYPSAEMMYPQKGILVMAEGGEEVVCDVTTTPAWKNYYLKALDIATGIIGVAGATGAIFLSGGLATPFVAASVGSAIYATGRSIDILRDKNAHKESLNPIYDGEARTAWLSLTAHVITFGTMGHIAALSSLATTGHSIAMGFKVCNFINETGNIISDLVICDTLSLMHSNYYNASIETKLAHAASICFWTKSFISLQNAEKIMKNNAIVALQLFGFENSFCHHFDDPIAMDIGLRIMTNSLRSDTTVSAGADGKSLIIDGYKFDILSIISFEPAEIKHLFDILSAVKDEDREAFNKTRTLFNNDPKLVELISREAEAQKIPVADLTEMLLKVCQSFLNVEDIKIDVTDSGIVIGNGFKTSIISAYDIFVLRLPDSDSLITALTELTEEECAKLNTIIEKSEDHIQLFDWFSEVGCDDSTKIKVQISNFINMSSF